MMMADTHEHGSHSLLDLPESLLVHILRQLPTETKCRAELVCKAFRDVLRNPTPGHFVWDVVRLDDPVFSNVPLSVLNKWLLRRIQGVLTLQHIATWGENGPFIEATSDEAVRDQHILSTTLPLLSGVLSPGAGVHMDLTWVTAKCLFTTELSASHFWSCMSTSLTDLGLHTPEEVTEDMSAVLSKLTNLRRLALNADLDTAYIIPEALIILDLPLLEELNVGSFCSTVIRLDECPKLQELYLEDVGLEGFWRMPRSIRKVWLHLTEQSVPLEEIFPAHSAKLLEYLFVGECCESTDPATVQELCLNGRLKRLCIDAAAAAAKAFSVGVSWRAVPHTLEDVTLELSLENGIPDILEQLPRLTSLSLSHKGPNPAHLTRPLDPFLDMPRMGKLELSRWGDNSAVRRGTKTAWTAVALRFIGMADRRIMQMQLTRPGRSIRFAY